MKKPSRPAGKPARPRPRPTTGPSGTAPKSSFDLVMERLRAADRESGIEETPLTAAQKAEVAEARRVAASRLAEREIHFRDAIQKIQDPAEREKTEREYQIDRQRINDDCERAIEAIRARRV
jgi:hypothetical protein